MRPLRPRKDRRQRRGAALAWWLLSKPHLDVLITHQLHTGTPMRSPAPVTPEERKVANDKRVEQHTHLARFTSGFAIPLTLLAQGTGTTTADTGPIHPRVAQRDDLSVKRASQARSIVQLALTRDQKYLCFGATDVSWNMLSSSSTDEFYPVAQSADSSTASLRNLWEIGTSHSSSV